jgi:diguanylate cyclase (GGDEF)-like protein
VEAEAALARQASTDALTGLPNRRETFRRLEELTAAQGTMGEAERPGIALAFCDIDHFKRVNDSLGHAAGDALLLAIGQRLRSALRPDDLVGRIGGDELLVVVVGVADLQTAMERAEALRAAVRGPLPISNNHLDVTASIGVTLFQQGESVDALVARADAAMYQAKQAGRDRVIPIQP